MMVKKVNMSVGLWYFERYSNMNPAGIVIVYRVKFPIPTAESTQVSYMWIYLTGPRDKLYETKMIIRAATKSSLYSYSIPMIITPKLTANNPTPVWVMTFWENPALLTKMLKTHPVT